MRRTPTILALLLAAGCGGPTETERENRKAFEFLLTAVSLKNPREVEKDATRIDDRHAAGQLSDAMHQKLKTIIEQARQGKWDEAERLAYEFRETSPFFR